MRSGPVPTATPLLGQDGRLFVGLVRPQRRDGCRSSARPPDGARLFKMKQQKQWSGEGEATAGVWLVPPPSAGGERMERHAAGGEEARIHKRLHIVQRGGDADAPPPPPAAPPLTVVLAVRQLLLRRRLRLPETLLEEVDQGLAEVLLRSLAVQEVPLVWVDLQGVVGPLCD